MEEIGTQRLRRRELIGTGVAAAGALALGSGFWESLARPAQVGPGPYGPLRPANSDGIRLPEGFRSRVIARGLLPVPGTLYLWHIFSDGAATFATPDGWVLVSNSEIPTPIDLPLDLPIGSPGEGGASAVRFGPGGGIRSAYRILSGTSSNCAGGPTPWGTWMSCEETERGMVWECDPLGRERARARPEMGVFTHEAACIDERTGIAYLTEDEGEGCFYRFVPEQKGDLSRGTLEVACVKRGRVEWKRVPDPSAASTPTRDQVPEATRFARGEGIWFDSGTVYVATTGDSRIWAYDTRRERIKIVYDPSEVEDPPLTDVDNITVHRQSKDLFVCEDNGDDDGIDIALITPGGADHRGVRRVSRFLQLTGHRHRLPEPLASEAAGVCFNPRGDRMYFASQRALGVGIVYEVSGPFRRIG